MADWSMYHSLGQGEEDKNNNHTRIVPAAPQFAPPVAQHPSGYPYGSAIPPSGPYGSVHTPVPPAGVPPPPPPPPPQQNQAPAPVDPQGGIGGLAAQMGGLGIAGDMGSIRGHKKKHRHAHHEILPPSGSSQAFGGMPQGQVQNPSQFLDTGINQFSQQHASPTSPMQRMPPGMQHPHGAGDGSVPTHGKVDPAHIPGVPSSRDLAAQYYLNQVYPTLAHHRPPPATIPFIAQDQGVSSPKFARLTLNNIPFSADTLSSTSLPLGMIIQPLAPLDSGEQTVPVLDFGDAGPPRCRRCRTYINPFMIFKAGGNKFICNMCTFPNDTQPEYYAPLDHSGVRVDRMHRPELMLGTVEFMVPKEYWNKEPVGLRWLFVLDVSQEAVNSGFLEACCEGIMGALYGGDEENEDGNDEISNQRLPPAAKVGIVTFDKEIHFYNLSSSLQQAQMIVMPDLDDPFVPLNEGLFVDRHDSKHVISSLLSQIPTLFSQIKNPEPALLPTINAAFSALQETGGKILCSLASLPTWGPGHLFLREDGKGQGTDAEKRLFTTEHAGWKKVAMKMAENGVGLDFFVAASGGKYIDIATIGHASAVSGGEVFLYPNFQAPRDVLKLSSELSHSINRETGFQALLKVRCSNGLQVTAYHGNFLQHTFGADLLIGSVDADKAFGVTFNHDGKLDSKIDAHFQAALLYTTANGQRRVRCINSVAAVNEGGMDTMQCLDQDAIVNILIKEAASKMPEKSLKDIRASLSEKTIDILASYRKNFSTSQPPGQLVLPEHLKEFPMYLLSSIKSRPFKGGQEPSDRRVHDLRMLRSFGCRELGLYLYPRIIPIHNMRPEDGFANSEGKLQVPPSIRASFSQIDEGGAYIVDNGQICLIWIHANVSPNLLEDLFGSGHTSLASLDANTSSLPVLESHLNAQVRNILQYLSTIRGSKAVAIQLARQGLDGAEYEFARLLVEDRNSEAQNYVDWLVHLHRQIQLELGGHRKKEDGEASGVGSMESTLTGLAGLRPPYW
ncbi:COPII coat Sec23p-Sfb3p heterodimer component [Ophidiomyces ophidiicola]|uniref:COPII coat Sec23p-Sfb3p heterodimer component n=1 Tax=Ophidiomyces ophidiicola TaxID=1387563 RepID=UPI0020C32143|nr:COPII coat Sec23p-Sfb3p heterodimer component [Ophidiomyces ophidiicola]KAI1942150.1 COPII coat Sec23p-Sfb3p heterodimer component [Ophidiomyces ophidiicola]KAI1951600.1 COPII coat Sec23p-Sfb3p heterodimer component [Ophidiomyces ophidiicola]KAI2033069.1 COPII coat Sec23p-Sfb3p heterodimer component [Ophidiomyces ophidiicola]KAI2056552.1 COPII coat Sec23p-Sfb3p heterodimer component [Ophidiomyces ophidiicola]KAI2060480.1 COPII coat Sec23p-Sfb3p heterodimer component [Ophidiomyces ophidiicol